MAVLCLLLALVHGSACSQAAWPTRSFEVYEGVPSEFWGQASQIERARVAGLENSDSPSRPKRALTPALKQEMETYLGEVATELERAGFPAPDMEPLITRSDGTQVYRVYYFDFSASWKSSIRDSMGGAMMNTGCPGERQLRRMLLNASPRPDLRITASSAGNTVPGTVDRMTPKGYGDLAHELFHAVQWATPFFRRNCNMPRWINEGQAEAVGHDLAWRLRQVRSLNDQPTRWGARSYARALADTPDDLGDMLVDPPYGASSYWRYLAELERSRRQRGGLTRKPGPELPTSAHAYDYRYMARLLNSTERVQGDAGMVDWLDRWLRADSLLGVSFARSFADFISTFHAFAGTRIQRTRPLDEIEQTWSRALFETGCPELKLDALAPTRIDLDLAPVSARCVRLQRVDTWPRQLGVDIRSVVPKEQGRNLTLGVSGGRRVQRAERSLAPGESHEIASWTLVMEPGEHLDLVFVNVADSPSQTRPLRLGLQFSSTGWIPEAGTLTPPAAARAAPDAAERPRPQGTRPANLDNAPTDPPTAGVAADTTGATAEATTMGPGTARVERATDTPAQSCRWPYSDAALQCAPQMLITLTQLPETLAQAGAVRDAGGWLTQTLGQAGANPLAAALAPPTRPLRIEITLPQLPYGSAGVVVPHALLRIRGGGWPEAVSRGPTDVEPGTMAYFPASGRVTIEAYDALELRGRFEAELVEEPVPQSTRGDRPTLPVLGRIAGRFSIGQPWRGDAAYVAQTPSLDDVDFDIHERLPGSGQAEADQPAPRPPADRDRAPPAPAASSRPPPGAGGQAATGCDCSCAGYRSLLKRLDLAGRAPSSSQQVADSARQTACFVTCGAAYARCDDEDE